MTENALVVYGSIAVMTIGKRYSLPHIRVDYACAHSLHVWLSDYMIMPPYVVYAV